MNKLLLLFSLFVPSVYAGDICSRSQADISLNLQESSSRISFKNGGGLINGGVCWWHSRLQRSSAYLVQFRPEKAPPTAPELRKIIHSLRMMNEVVIIPGYSDFYTFSHDYKKQLQAMLEDWQKTDGFLNFEWIRGISGNHQLPAGKMQERMNEVYRFFKKSPAPVWLMAQIKGITSHSLLLHKMKQTERGYVMEVIDSNHPEETLFIEYFVGDSSLKNDDYTFVPYVGFQNDFVKIFKAISGSCRESLAFPEIEEGEVEINLLNNSTEKQH